LLRARGLKNCPLPSKHVNLTHHFVSVRSAPPAVTRVLSCAALGPAPEPPKRGRWALLREHSGAQSLLLRAFIRRLPVSRLRLKRMIGLWPDAPLTRVGTSVRCVLLPLSPLLVSGFCILFASAVSAQPPHITSFLVGQMGPIRVPGPCGTGMTSS
jgi:hypothetical protein